MTVAPLLLLVALLFLVAGAGFLWTAVGIMVRRGVSLHPRSLLTRHPEIIWLRDQPDTTTRPTDAPPRPTAVEVGEEGERRVRELLTALDPDAYTAFHTIFVPTPEPRPPDGPQYTEADHIVVSSFGVFVIETKNWRGRIYGGPSDHSWTIRFPGGQQHIRANPLRQNAGHVHALRHLLALEVDQVRSFVALMGDARFAHPERLGRTVCFGDELLREVQAYNTPELDALTKAAVLAKLRELDLPAHRAEAREVHRREVVERPPNGDRPQESESS